MSLIDKPPKPKPSPRRSLPLREAIVQAPGAMLLALLFTSGYGVANYLTMVFLPTYAAEFGGGGHSVACSRKNFSACSLVGKKLFSERSEICSA